MNEERKAGLAKITARIRIKHWSQCGITSDDGEWLLALVKELDEENARLLTREDELERAVNELNSYDAPAEVLKERGRADRAEQQLAAVTAERDELKREVERLRTGQSTMRTRIDVEIARAEKAEAELAAIRADMAVAEDYPAHYWRELCQKAETERDALRAELAEAKAPEGMTIQYRIGGYLIYPAISGGEWWLNGSNLFERCASQEAAATRARELARLKGEKGGG